MLLTSQLPTLPAHTGVYLFRDSRQQLLYVGKAKSLRHRVRSYFKVNKKTNRLSPNPTLDSNKQLMVQRISSIDTIATDTETEALVLEATLIRQHQPPYNVLLRDDKFYLFIKVTTNEKEPRVFPVRKLKSDGAKYFGPYSSASAVRQTLQLLRRIFPHPTEKENLRDKTFPHPLFHTSTLNNNADKSHHDAKIASQPSSSALSPHKNIEHIIKFLRGDRQAIIAILRQGMIKAAHLQRFEQAAIFRNQLQAIERLEGNQKVFLPRRESFDVLSLARRHQHSAMNVFSLRQGKLLHKNTFLLRHPASASLIDILRQFILQYYQVAQDIPRLILLPHLVPDHLAIAKTINRTDPPVFRVPKRGPKRQLQTMGTLNAKHFLLQLTEAFTNAQQTQQALQDLSAIIFTPTDKPSRPPSLSRIETYDISNIQGQLATGSMVVFTEGQPNKNQYRKFKIKLTKTPNDYAMLEEVLTRRFSGRHSEWPLPDLILIDGGRGQLNVAQRILKKLNVNLPLASLSKRNETLHFYTPTVKKIPSASLSRPVITSVNLPYDSSTLFLLQQMRDEAHRFTITYHRLLRSRNQTRSVLDNIPQLGPKTKQKLHRHFGSLRAIRAASTEELTKVIGPKKAHLLRDWL